VSGEDSRLTFEAALVQRFAYELLPLVLIVSALVPPDWAGVAINLGAVGCLVGDFFLLRALLDRS
jgi:hypothetical protein